MVLFICPYPLFSWKGKPKNKGEKQLAGAKIQFQVKWIDILNHCALLLAEETEMTLETEMLESSFPHESSC